MPKVSIIVTTYNVDTYIRSCLDDIVSQTLKDIEIIVVDDGSTDSTPEIILEYAGRDSRIRPVLFKRNTIGGVASAANAGMEIATGDYIGFADGDDLYDHNMFEMLWRSAASEDADLAMCRYTLLDESDGQEKEPADASCWIPYDVTTGIDLDVESRKQILQFISVPWRKLYRRDLVERISLRFPVGDFFYEDNPFHWDAVINAQRIVLVPEKLCKHRVARVGQTMSTVDERLLRVFDHHDIIRGKLASYKVLEIYKDSLLLWLNSQISWVSQRTTGNLRPLLYGKLFPIVDQYSAHELAEFTRAKGKGRALQMLQALKVKDYQQFSIAAGWLCGADRSVSLIDSKYQYPRDSIIDKTLYPLRRLSSRMNVRYVKRKLGLSKMVKSQANLPLEVGQQSLDHLDIMASMIVLQHEIRALRREVTSLTSQTADVSMKLEQTDQILKK